jgi:3-oxoacyl-[acyl-carrier protein] reductase
MKLPSIIIKVNKVFKKNMKAVYIPLLHGYYLEGKNVVITGGTSGIGFSIAKLALMNGASVVITGRTHEKNLAAIKRLNEELGSINNELYSIELDIKETETFQSKLTECLSLFTNNKIDILINNAGTSSEKYHGQAEVDYFSEIMDTNLKGTYFITQVFSNYMIENKIEGNILNILSSSSIRPAINPYMISKWGGLGFTKGMAKKLIKYGIVVNAIAPGPTATSMINRDSKNLRHERSPSGRICDPYEIANLSVILTSRLGRMIVGETLFVTGGSGTLTFDDIDY